MLLRKKMNKLKKIRYHTMQYKIKQNYMTGYNFVHFIQFYTMTNIKYQFIYCIFIVVFVRRMSFKRKDILLIFKMKPGLKILAVRKMSCRTGCNAFRKNLHEIVQTVIANHEQQNLGICHYVLFIYFDICGSAYNLSLLHNHTQSPLTFYTNFYDMILYYTLYYK